MHVKKTYICLEPGEHHPAMCVLEKYSEKIGHLNPTFKMIYDVRTLEALPSGMTNIDMREKITARMKTYIMGDIRCILGYTYITEQAKRFFEGTSLKPVKITVTGEEKSYKDNFMIYVPYSEMLHNMDELNAQDSLVFGPDILKSKIIEDDDLDLALLMTIWYAYQDTEHA